MSDTSNRVRVGFIGAGGICKTRHLPGLKELDIVDLVAVCNRTPTSSQAIAAEWGFKDTMSDWRQLVERDDIDAVFIGTWPYMHREMSVAALDAGKHVFCQARMCMDWAEALDMATAAKRHPELVAMLCPPPHRMPWEPKIKQLISSGELGDLRSIELRDVNAANTDPSRITWREQKQFSGLHILAMGIWAETLNAWVGEYDHLQAVTSTPITEKITTDGRTHRIEIPQVVSISGHLASGTHITEYHSGLSLHEAASSVVIQGSKATLHINAMKSIRFAPAGSSFADLPVDPSLQNPWTAEADFIRAVRSARAGQPWSVDPDFTAGLRYMRKVQAVHDSACRGKTVSLQKDYPLP